jgi:hypothetical protein
VIIPVENILSFVVREGIFPADLPDTEIGMKLRLA